MNMSALSGCVLGALGGQKDIMGPLELELQMLVSHHEWELNWGSSGRAVSAFKP